MKTLSPGAPLGRKAKGFHRFGSAVGPWALPDGWQLTAVHEGPPSGKIRLAILDDHPPFRDALRSILSTNPHIETVGELGNGHSVLGTILEQEPDILLLDLMMPEVGAISTLKRIQ